MTSLQNTFTSQDAVRLFKEHTGFEFHPTIPGQLLARCGIYKIPSTLKPSRFDATHWDTVWEEMFYLALHRCRFDRRLQAPKKCVAPELPQAQVTKPALRKEPSASRLPSDLSQNQARNPVDQLPPTSAAEALLAALQTVRNIAGKAGPSRARISPLEQRLIEFMSERKNETKCRLPASGASSPSRPVQQEQPPGMVPQSVVYEEFAGTGV